MVLFRSISLAAVLSQVSAEGLRERDLSFKLICSYEPFSKVGDHLAIAGDQNALEGFLGDPPQFQNAKLVYEQGAFSKSYAKLMLKAPLADPIAKGTEMTGKNAAGNDVFGKAYDAYEGAANVNEIHFQYQSTEAGGSECQVGGLGEAGGANTDACLVAEGSVEVGGKSLEYTYNVDSDNDNGRTLQGFSLQAKDKMFDCNDCPQPEYEKFFRYYGTHEYADEWVQAALAGRSTTFPNKGQADFSQYGNDGRIQAVKKGTAYMNVWMYVMREFWDAIEDCNNEALKDNDDKVIAWDEGVAFYTGTLQTCGSDDGNLLYALANKRCANFKTCGKEGNTAEGNSYVNEEIFKVFNQGKQNLQALNCDAAEENVKRISQLMTIPVIQGALRYAYRVGENGENEEKPRSEGAAFAAAVLPLVDGCSEADATTIYDNLKVGSGDIDFAAVKKAFENTYGCLGIKCEEVGGLLNPATDGEYYAGAEPCGVTTPPAPTPSPPAPTPSPPAAGTQDDTSAGSFNSIHITTIVALTALSSLLLI